MRILPAMALGAALLAALTGSAAAQERRVPTGAEIKLSFAPIVQRVAPAVVNVYAAKVVENRNPLFDDPWFRRFFGNLDMPRERVQRSLGSGVMVDPAGLVVTNNHVIEGASEVKVALADKREFEAEIVLKDARTDLAVLRIKGNRERFPVIEFADSDDMQVGDVVLAIGNPFAVGQTVTQGIVSALARSQVGIADYQFFIQTDAAINPGNSGGALVDVNGRLAGINTAIYSRSGGSIGIGFAIPANMVKVVVASARGGGGAVKRPWLGARLQALDTDTAENLKLARPSGALVGNVVVASPAGRAGLKTGDVIVGVDGQPVEDPNAFEYRFVTKPLGRTAQLDVWRSAKETKLTIALEAPPARDELQIRSRSPLGGATVATLSPALAEELRLDGPAEGVVIVDVGDGSFAQNFGFQRGDRVVSVNDESIARARDLERVFNQQSRAWQITISRGGKPLSRIFRL